jgi:hypothetical protein
MWLTLSNLAKRKVRGGYANLFLAAEQRVAAVRVKTDMV